jgi:phage gp36-like protein
MSIYATVLDVEQAFGLREINMIADRNQDGAYEVDVVQQHLDAAEQQINFAVAQRCTLPLVGAAPEIMGRLKQWALDITRYRLTGSSGITVTADVDARYKETKDDLDKVTSGKVVLCAQGTGTGVGGVGNNGLLPNSLTPGMAEVVDTSQGADAGSCCRQWDGFSLRDFTRLGRGFFGGNNL